MTVVPASFVLVLLAANAAIAEPLNPDRPTARSALSAVVAQRQLAQAGAQDERAAFLRMQAKDERFVGELKGLAVVNSDGTPLGNIKDISIDFQGRVASIVLGVGGFLGIGEKTVAVRYDRFRMTLDRFGNDVAVLNVSEKALEAAPKYLTLREQNAIDEAWRRAMQRAMDPTLNPSGIKK